MDDMTYINSILKSNRDCIRSVNDGTIYDSKGNRYRYHIKDNFEKYICVPRNCRPSITKVVYNDPATIVFWDDGTKTVVKCQEGDTYDWEKGLAMAICKKAFGNKGNYCNLFKNFAPDGK